MLRKFSDLSVSSSFGGDIGSTKGCSKTGKIVSFPTPASTGLFYVLMLPSYILGLPRTAHMSHSMDRFKMPPPIS